MPSETDDVFHSIYAHGFVRATVCVPFLRVADPAYNADRTIALARRASDMRAAIALFPELGLSAYSNEDLFHQDALLGATLQAIARVTEASRALTPLLLVGAPLRVHDKLFNCAIAIHRGRVLGVTPKTYLPNYREFYEARQFAPAHEARRRSVELAGQSDVPFGSQLLFRVRELPLFRFHVEICEDL